MLMKIKNEWWTCTFYPFYNFRTSKDLEILRQSSYMSLILKGLSKRNTHIPHIVLYDEEKWQKMCSNAYFGVFRGGGHFWRVTRIVPYMIVYGTQHVTALTYVLNGKCAL